MSSLIEFPTRQSPATLVTKNASTPSAEILRACDLLREVICHNEEDGEGQPVAGHVVDGVNEIVDTLQALVGLQMMWETWNAS